jgi:hypothetical protein
LSVPAPIHRNLLLDPSPNGDRAAAFVVLAKWYAAHSAIRRLWAISDSHRMRVIVTLEPTHDGNDIYPAWLANGHEWTHELQLLVDAPVQLEVMDEPSLEDFAAGVDDVLVAELFWRDSSTPPDDLPDSLSFAR